MFSLVKHFKLKLKLVVVDCLLLVFDVVLWIVVRRILSIVFALVVCAVTSDLLLLLDVWAVIWFKNIFQINVLLMNALLLSLTHIVWHAWIAWDLKFVYKVLAIVKVRLLSVILLCRSCEIVLWLCISIFFISSICLLFFNFHHWGYLISWRLQKLILLLLLLMLDRVVSPLSTTLADWKRSTTIITIASISLNSRLRSRWTSTWSSQLFFLTFNRLLDIFTLNIL